MGGLNPPLHIEEGIAIGSAAHGETESRQQSPKEQTPETRSGPCLYRRTGAARGAFPVLLHYFLCYNAESII